MQRPTGGVYPEEYVFAPRCSAARAAIFALLAHPSRSRMCLTWVVALRWELDSADAILAVGQAVRDQFRDLPLPVRQRSRDREGPRRAGGRA